MAAVQGITMHMYIDDWLIRGQSSKIVSSHCEWFLNLNSMLGLRVNFLKSDLVPSQDLTFIGYRFVTRSNQVFPPQKRIDTLVQLLGMLAATEKLVPLGRCRILGLLQPVPSSSSASGLAGHTGPSVVVCSRSSMGGSSLSPSSVGDVQGQFRLGSLLPGPGCVRPVVLTGTSPAYQQSGVAGCIQSSSSLGEPSIEQSCVGSKMLVYFFKRGVPRSHGVGPVVPVMGRDMGSFLQPHSFPRS